MDTNTTYRVAAFVRFSRDIRARRNRRGKSRNPYAAMITTDRDIRTAAAIYAYAREREQSWKFPADCLAVSIYSRCAG